MVELALDAGYGLSPVQTPCSNRKLESVRTLESVGYSGGRGRGMSSIQRPLGTWIADGADEHDLDETPEPSLQDVAPTLMRAMGFSSTMGVISIMLHSTTDFNLQIFANAATFMIILALPYLAISIERRRSSQPFKAV